MEPNDQPPTTPTELPPKQQEDQDAYAEALVRMVALDAEMDEKHGPAQKHLISKKTVIYLLVSLVLSVITLIAGNTFVKNSTPNTNSEDTTKKLLDSTKEIRSLENENY